MRGRALVSRARDMDMASDRKYGDAGIENGNPIAAQVIGKMRKAVHGNLVNLRSVVAGRAAAEVVTEGELAGFHPAHGAYVYVQNTVSVMLGALMGFPAV